MSKDNIKTAQDSITAMIRNYKKLNGVDFPKLPSVINPVPDNDTIKANKE